MVDTTVTAEEDTFDAECYSDSLISSKDDTIRAVCAKISEGNGVHVTELTTCLNTENFCKECCNHHHGTILEVKRK